MRKPNVVAFLGRAGSGKSTASNYLVEKYGAQKVTFAGPLKRLAQHLLQFTDEQMYGTQEVKEKVDERYGFSSREFMQRLGDGARECLDPLIWIKAAMNDMLGRWRKDPGKDLFVVEDCRYVNEVELIVNSNDFIGRVVKLTCPDATATSDPNHPSEAQVDLVQPGALYGTITSKKSPGSKDLIEKVDAMVQTMFVPQTSTSEVFKTHNVEA